MVNQLSHPGTAIFHFKDTLSWCHLALQLLEDPFSAPLHGKIDQKYFPNLPIFFLVSHSPLSPPKGSSCNFVPPKFLGEETETHPCIRFPQLIRGKVKTQLLPPNFYSFQDVPAHTPLISPPLPLTLFHSKRCWKSFPAQISLKQTQVSQSLVFCFSPVQAKVGSPHCLCKGSTGICALERGTSVSVPITLSSTSLVSPSSN